MIYKEFRKVRLIFLNSSFLKKYRFPLLYPLEYSIPLKQTIMGWIRLIFKVVNIFPSVNEKKKKSQEEEKWKSILKIYPL